MPSALGRLVWPMSLMLATSCDAGVKPGKPAEQKQATDQKQPPAVPDAGVPVGSDIVVSVDAVKGEPIGPFVVHYDCFHSNAPFGPGEQYRNLTYDLGARTVATQAWETTDDPTKPLLDDKPKPPPKPVVAKLSASHVEAIEAAVAAVLRAGKLEPEYPVPEGTPCTLKIERAGKEVFSLAKASANKKDAATDLLKALGGGQ